MSPTPRNQPLAGCTHVARSERPVLFRNWPEVAASRPPPLLQPFACGRDGAVLDRNCPGVVQDRNPLELRGPRVRFPPPPPSHDLRPETDSDTSRPDPDKLGQQQGLSSSPSDPAVQGRTHPTHDQPKERHEKCLACVQRPRDLAELEDLWSRLPAAIRRSLLDLAKASASKT